MHRRVVVLDVHGRCFLNASSSPACQTGLGTRAVMVDRAARHLQIIALEAGSRQQAGERVFKLWRMRTLRS